MGSLKRFDLNRIIKDYNIAYLFETGTFLGDGVAYAQQSNFKKIFSVEIIPQIAADARKRFANDTSVEIITADSISALQKTLPTLNENIIFWLDAHFPGADAGLTHYDADNNEELRLPLTKELATISKLRVNNNDVFILDDLRIYEDGPYELGNVPTDALPKTNRNLNFVYEYFDKSHFIIKSYLDEGYTILFPKKRYKKVHFKWSNLFKKDVAVDDLYLAEK